MFLKQKFKQSYCKTNLQQICIYKQDLYQWHYEWICSESSKSVYW